MEVQLQELLEKIQNEGVKEAERKADQIVRAAEEKAAALTKKATVEAEALVAKAKQQGEELEARGRAALRQAGRDLLLKLRQAVIAQFDALLKTEIKAVLKQKTLEDVIVRVVEAWTKKESTGADILVAADDAERVRGVITAKFKETTLKGIEIKPVAGVDAGFRIGEKNGAAFYDVTDEGLTELLAAFVNPLLARTLSEAAGDAGR